MSRAVSTDTTIAPAVDRDRMVAAVLKLREIASETAERLLTLLDDLDGDPDLDGDDDWEPSTGPNELLDECEPDDDGEPSLGAAENHPLPSGCYGEWTGSQLNWTGGNLDDREGDEHDGGEPEEYLVDGRNPIDQRELASCP